MSFSLRWLGHASFRVKAEGKAIYIDPYEGDYSEKADLILVTHSHHDHCDIEKIRKIRKPDTIVVAPEDCVSKIGSRVKLIKAGQEITFGRIKIKAVESYNIKRFKSPGNPFHPKGFGIGYLITFEEKTVYHAGDSDFVPEMEHLGTVDVALLPSGGTYTMDNPEAAEAAIAINPRIAIPIHRWNTNPEEFKKKLEARSKIKIVVLPVCEEFQVV